MILHTDIFVKSIDKSLDFYVDKLGFRIEEDFMVKGDLVKHVSNGLCNEYRLVLLNITFGSSMLEIMEFSDIVAEKDYKKIPISKTNITILVESLEMKIKELKEKNVHPSSKIFNIETPKYGKSRIIFYDDPDRNVIEFIEMVK